MDYPENVTRLTNLEHTDVDDGDVNFGLTDQKGRVIGYCWCILSVTGKPISVEQLEALRLAGKWTSYHQFAGDWPTTFFEVETSVTRDGLRYGATVVKGNYARTLDEAKAIVAKRTINARKAYTRKFAKEPA